MTLKALYGQWEIMALINDYRQAEGLSVLLEEEVLHKTAEEYAGKLVNQGYLSHKDLEGNRVLQRYKDHGGTGSAAGEILGSSIDFNTLFQAWIDSPGHKSVIENPHWTRIGWSIVEQDCQLVAVVLFSRSEILQYNLERSGEELILSMEAIEGKELQISGSNRVFDSSGSYSFTRDELPLLLVVNGGSDFLYLSDNFFK